MKRFLIITAFSVITLLSNAQIVLEHTYNYSTTVVQLETLGYKYYLMDVPNSQCKIYNMDHSIYKTINCAVPNGYFLSDIKFVSEKLFDSDTEIEIAYTYYKYVATTTSYYYIYGSRIVNENGSNEIPAIENAQYLLVNKTGDSQYKLFAYCYDYSVFPETVWTNIYSLPGKLNTAISGLNQSGVQNLKVYPNPATDVVIVEYLLPESVSTAKLQLLDSNGRTIKSFNVDGHSDHLSLNVNELVSGVYHYFIQYDNSRSVAKKLIVQ